MPLVTVASRPNGEPIATTPWPTCEARGVPDGGRREVVDALGLDHRGVGERVGAEDLGGGVRAVVERDARSAGLAGQGDDVVVGEDLAVGLRMMPEPEPDAVGAGHVDHHDGGQHALGDLLDRAGRPRSGTVEPPLWVSTGDDCTESSWVEVQSAAPPTPAAPPTSRLAATTVAASPLPASPLRGRGSGGRTGPLDGRAEGGTARLVRAREGCEPVRRPGRGRSRRLLAPLVSVAGPARRTGTRSLMPQSLPGESGTFAEMALGGPEEAGRRSASTSYDVAGTDHSAVHHARVQAAQPHPAARPRC